MGHYDNCRDEPFAPVRIANPIEAQPMRAFIPPNALPPIGTPFRIEHDGFEGLVIGYYTRLDGKRGVVGQQIGTNIVHVYGEKWLKP